MDVDALFDAWDGNNDGSLNLVELYRVLRGGGRIKLPHLKRDHITQVWEGLQRPLWPADLDVLRPLCTDVIAYVSPHRTFACSRHSGRDQHNGLADLAHGECNT